MPKNPINKGPVRRLDTQTGSATPRPARNTDSFGFGNGSDKHSGVFWQLKPLQYGGEVQPGPKG